MKVFNYVIFCFGLILIVIFGTLYNNFVFKNDNVFDKMVKSKMVHTVDIKGNFVRDFISTKEKEVSLLANSNKVKKLLKSEIESDENVSLNFLNEEMKVIVSSANRFLARFPEMTVKDLQENSVFKQLVIHKFGENSFSSVVDENNQTVILSYLEGDNGKNVADVKRDLKYVLTEKKYLKDNKILLEAGVLEFNGVREKYIVLNKKLNVSTSDGIFLSINLVGRIQDNKIIKKISKSTKVYLDSFLENKNIHNIVFVSKDGNLVYMGNRLPVFGMNLNIINNIDRGFSESYSKLIKNLDEKLDEVYSYSGPYRENGIYLNSVISNIFTPVYDFDGSYLGAVGLSFSMDEIYKNMEIIADLSKSEEIYLVSNEGKLLSPLKYQNSTILIQDIDEVDIEECFVKNNSLDKLDYIDRKNYYGINVLRSYDYINKFNWCMVIDIAVSEILDESKEKIVENDLKLLYLVFGGLFIFIILIGFGLNYFYGVKEDTRRLLLFKKYTFINSMKRVELRTKILISIFLPFIYYLVVIYFIHGFRKASLIQSVPDLFISSVCFMILFWSLSYGNLRGMKYLIIGTLSFIVSNCFEIVFQEFQITSNPVPEIYWFFTLIFSIIGIIFIFLGFRRELK